MRHMDDFVVIGAKQAVQSLLADLKETLQVSGVEILERVGQRIQFLGRTITRTSTGYSVGAAAALIAEIIEEEGLQGAKSTTKPGAKHEEDEDTAELADAWQHAHFRSQTGRLLFAVVDRPDMQHSVLRLTRKVAKPSLADMAALHKVVRYLLGTRDYQQQVELSEEWSLAGRADADWGGGDGLDRRSVSGGSIRLAGAVLLTFARMQQVTSLSSGEAELYALTAVAAEVLYWDGLLAELGIVTRKPPVVWTDSSAALAMTSRRGQKRMKHVELRCFVAQDWVAASRLSFRKIAGLDNEADLMTKFLDVTLLQKHTAALGVRRFP